MPMYIAIPVILILAILGGVANILLIHGKFIKPFRDENGNLVPGFWGNIILGFLAGVAIVLLNGNDFMLVMDKHDIPTAFKLMFLSLLAGIGGGNILTSLLQKNLLSDGAQKNLILEKISNELLNKIEEKGKK